MFHGIVAFVGTLFHGNEGRRYMPWCQHLATWIDLKWGHNDALFERINQCDIHHILQLSLSFSFHIFQRWFWLCACHHLSSEMVGLHCLASLKDLKGWVCTKGVEHRPWCLSCGPALATRCPAVCEWEGPAAGSFPRPAEPPGDVDPLAPHFFTVFFSHHLFGKLVFSVDRRDAVSLHSSRCNGNVRSVVASALTLPCPLSWVGSYNPHPLGGAILHLASIPSFGGGQASPCSSDHFRWLDSPGC